MSVHWSLLWLVPPPTGQRRPAHVVYVSVRPSPDVQVLRNVTSALELAAQGAPSLPPITLFWRKSHEEVRTVRSALLLTVCMSHTSFRLVLLLSLDVWHINEDASFGIYLVGTDFPMWTQLKSRHKTDMSRRKQGKPQHLSKREFSRKCFWLKWGVFKDWRRGGGTLVPCRVKELLSGTGRVRLRTDSSPERIRNMLGAPRCFKSS